MSITNIKDLYINYYNKCITEGMNPHQIPKISKIVVQTGIRKLLSENANNLSIIKSDYVSFTQQEPVVIKSKKNIAAFSLRIGDTVGIKATLRQDRMYDFMNRLIFLVTPRLRFFEGFSDTMFDKQGNFTIGLSDMRIFYELDPSVRKVLTYGCSITFTIINCKDSNTIKQMLQYMFFYFKEKINKK